MTMRHYFVRLGGRTYLVMASSRERAEELVRERYGGQRMNTE